MSDALVLETARGPFTLRPERAEDADFLYVCSAAICWPASPPCRSMTR